MNSTKPSVHAADLILRFYGGADEMMSKMM
jgi:hypothetical protein